MNDHSRSWNPNGRMRAMRPAHASMTVVHKLVRVSVHSVPFHNLVPHCIVLVIASVVAAGLVPRDVQPKRMADESKANRDYPTLWSGGRRSKG